ncbi:hypothetical protein MRX96_002461 [Rhipicephalus microplus]
MCARGVARSWRLPRWRSLLRRFLGLAIRSTRLPHCGPRTAVQEDEAAGGGEQPPRPLGPRAGELQTGHHNWRSRLLSSLWLLTNDKILGAEKKYCHPSRGPVRPTRWVQSNAGRVACR